MQATYEVRVKIKSKKPREYNSQLACWIYDEVVKMFHKLAKNPQQAMDKCRKHGTPLSARKLDVSVMHKDIEKLPILDGVYREGNPYSNAIAMDEMIWKKRNVRRDNMHRDKNKT